ncbi:Peflin [Geodia barretti]|uniref:Peflin n=1 Tax=Geodia barretti TaxID=519541 RepID=A0AA35SU35_GEOBA|nr:Peflin [Geodia barretti]
MSWSQPPYNPAYSLPSAAASGAQPFPPSYSLPPAPQPATEAAGPPPGVNPELWGWFQSVDADKSGKISAMELRQALVNSNWSHFNQETCRLLIGMFDQNRDGTIDVYEFAALWKYIQEWRQCFDRFDKDRSGNIDASELQQALNSFGYRLSMQFCFLCTRVFDRGDTRTMKFDDFIQCCVMLRSLTEGFKRLDTNRSGVVTINYEQFLEIAIDNTL